MSGKFSAWKEGDRAAFPGLRQTFSPSKFLRAARVLLGCCLGFLLGSLWVSTPAWSLQSQSPSAVAEEVGKAKALEVRGRSELAREAWEQILREDPGNAEALQGMIRASQATGREVDAEAYRKRLRAAHPDDPVSTQSTGRRLGSNREEQARAAEQLARAGKYQEAVAAYQKIYGTNPPPGDAALLYYAAEGATDEGRPQAIASLRALADRFPQDRRYPRALGSLLLLNARTEQEAEKLLGGHPAVGLAGGVAGSAAGGRERGPSVALFQSAAAEKRRSEAQVQLSDDVRNAGAAVPASDRSAASVEQQAVRRSRPAPLVLAKSTPPLLSEGSPNRPKAGVPVVERAPLAAATRVIPLNTASLPSGFAAGDNAEEERAGYAALSSGRLHEAEARFKVVLARDPENGRALEGLGLLRLRQGERAKAASLLEQAQAKGVQDAAIVQGLRQAGLPEATMSRQGEQVQVAAVPRDAEVPRAADSPPAPAQPLAGLSFPQASPPVARQGASQPDSRAARPGAALRPSDSGLRSSTSAPRSAASESQASASELRSSAPAQRSSAPAVFGQAPSPVLHSASTSSTDEELKRAAAFGMRGEPQQAVPLYRQILSAAPENSAAWSGLVTAQHRQRDEAAALQTLDRMPPSVLQAALREPGFALIAVSVETSGGRTGAAQQVLGGLLGRTPPAAGAAVGAVQLQLAGALLDEGKSTEAYAMFRGAIGNGGFENAQAWAGLLASLHESGHDSEALAQAESAPAGVRLQLQSNPLFLQTAALIYARAEDRVHALSYWERLERYAAAKYMAVPAEPSVAFAQWLGRSGDTAVDTTELYPLLMALGGRTDLSDAQRRALQRIWAQWAVRQAAEQARAGEPDRAQVTLGTATAAFSDNPEALRGLARGYASLDQPRRAVAMLRAQDLANASAEDMSLAVSAALAAHDTKTAEAWLRSGLLRYRSDPDLLLLASRFEQETGHRKESAVYLQAALSIAPAHTLPSTGGPAPKALADGASSSRAAPDLAALFRKAGAIDNASAGNKARANALPSERAKRIFLPSETASAAVSAAKPSTP